MTWKYMNLEIEIQVSNKFKFQINPSFKYFWVIRIEKQIFPFVWRNNGSTILFRDLLTFRKHLILWKPTQSFPSEETWFMDGPLWLLPSTGQLWSYLCTITKSMYSSPKLIKDSLTDSMISFRDNACKSFLKSIQGYLY